MSKTPLKNDVVRHAGVLGLSALVSLTPYHVEDWTPNVLTHLASHISDPSPIKDTVKNTFAEFWRFYFSTKKKISLLIFFFSF